MKSFKNKIQKIIITRILRKNERQVVFPCADNLKNIGFINVGDELINLGTNQLFLGCSVTYLNYINQKSTTAENNNNFIYKNNLNFWGLPKKSYINSFTNKPFDILFDLSEEDNPVIDYICARSLAKFKVSTRVKRNLFDLIIKLKQYNSESLIEETRRTLNNFNRKS